MKVKIIRSGLYSEFIDTDGYTKSSAKRREANEVVDYPQWYAESLIASGHARRVEVPKVEIAIVSPDPVMNITQAATKLAWYHDLDLTKITGTGKGGRIVLRDVREYIESEGLSIDE